jgi:hypothetical protein
MPVSLVHDAEAGHMPWDSEPKCRTHGIGGKHALLDWETVSLRPLHNSFQHRICPFPIPTTNWVGDLKSPQPERYLDGTAKGRTEEVSEARTGIVSARIRDHLPVDRTDL